MAAYTCEERKPHFPSIVDRDGNLPVSCSCFQLIKPKLDAANHHCSLDVFPIVFEEASFPVKENYPLKSSCGQDIYSISVLPEEDDISSQCASQLTLLSILEVPFPSKKQSCLDAQMNSQNCNDLPMEGIDAYPTCAVDINIEKEHSELFKPNGESIGSMKAESGITHSQKVLQRQPSINIDKSFTERVQDAPINRWRRYRRAASFDSRKIVVLFSILSSLGTLTLIYLTLRVRQTSYA